MAASDFLVNTKGNQAHYLKLLQAAAVACITGTELRGRFKVEWKWITQGFLIF